MKTFLKSFVQDESGASAAEYALILAVVGSAIVVAALALSGSIADSMCKTANTIANPADAENASEECPEE